MDCKLPDLPLMLRGGQVRQANRVPLKSSKKQIVAIGLLILMLIKAWAIPMVYLDFELRKDYIVANLCVNRNKPQLQCDGKCYLAKRIAQAQKQQERKAEQDYLANLIYQVMEQRTVFKLQPRQILNVIPLVAGFDYTCPFLNLLVAHDIFHPPLA